MPSENKNWLISQKINSYNKSYFSYTQWTETYRKNHLNNTIKGNHRLYLYYGDRFVMHFLHRPLTNTGQYLTEFKFRTS